MSVRGVRAPTLQRCPRLSVTVKPESKIRLTCMNKKALTEADIRTKFITPALVGPLPEQRRIVAKVEQLMALVDELEGQLATSRATAENLLSALVAELTSP